MIINGMISHPGNTNDENNNGGVYSGLYLYARQVMQGNDPILPVPICEKCRGTLFGAEAASARGTEADPLTDLSFREFFLKK